MNNNHTKEEKTANSMFVSRVDKLKEIESLYRQQIKKIHTDSKTKLDHQNGEDKKGAQDEQKSTLFKKQTSGQMLVNKQLLSPKSVSTLNAPESQSSESKMLVSGSQMDEKIRASVFLKGESTRTIEILRRENESKELKIRQLSNKCQNLVQKLKKYLNESEFQAEMDSLRKFSDGKMERLQHLFKIKQEEIFFKLKLQVIGLLQEFGVTKDQLAQFNDLSSESSLYSLMSRKLKNRLKDFRSQDQEKSFELQKDKIVNQKQEERIHFLGQTNQLLKLSESKLKGKVEDLKFQLNELLQRLKLRQAENQYNENQVFKLKKQNQQLQGVNQKLSAANKNAINERLDDKRLWEAKEKQMKVLLNNYFIEKKKLETELEEKDGEIQEVIIKYKFLEQENERINRELVRWKERYEWLQKEKTGKLRQIEEERSSILLKFEEYKSQFNQGILISQKGEVEQAIRKIEEYQRAYERVVLELQDERRLLKRAEEQTRQRFQSEERQWLQRFKGLEKIKEEQFFEINQDWQSRIRQLRAQHQQKQQLFAEQMQARLKAILAERDKRATEQMIQLQNENDQLRRQVGDLNKIIEVKESLINVINNKKA